MLDLGACVLGEQHPVTDFHIQRLPFAFVVAGTEPYGQHLAFLGLLFGGLGKDDARPRLSHWSSCDYIYLLLHAWLR